jgi:integrase
VGQRITQKLIQKLKPPPSSSQIEYDAEIPGFGVRITAAGVIAFVLNYWVHGRERRFTIGRYPELTATAARERALQLRGRIIDGHDPLAEREQSRTEPTLDDLAKQYLKEYAAHHKRPSSIRNDRDMINKIITPTLGKLRVKSVGRRDVELLHAGLKATPYRANRVLALLSKMFSLAIQWKLRADNPAHGVPRFHEDRRERWLSQEEMQRFSNALDSYSDQNAANALRLLLLTGAREGEVLKASWEQFDLKRGVWTKPSHHTKQQRIEHVPLSSAAITLLTDMKPKLSGGLLFPGADGDARVTLRRPWIQALRAAGLVEVIEVEGKRKGHDGNPRMLKQYKPLVRIHDLRHTYAISPGIQRGGPTYRWATSRAHATADDYSVCSRRGRGAAKRYGAVRYDLRIEAPAGLIDFDLTSVM